MRKLELNLQVAALLGHEDALIDTRTPGSILIPCDGDGLIGPSYLARDYVEDWAEAGPIMQRHKISIKYLDIPTAIHYAKSGGEYVPVFSVKDNNPLRAAMLVFLQICESKQMATQDE